ncbi:MAG TPA: thioredoxin family protein [Terriglobales bacterium]|nr:thioredoxin family protein [Terriglobales bacterium]
MLALPIFLACAGAQSKPAGAGSATAPSSSAPTFEPLGGWERALRAGDSDALRANFSSDPPVRLLDLKEKPFSLDEELAFWQARRAEGFKIVSVDVLDAGKVPKLPDYFREVTFVVVLQAPGSPPSPRYVDAAQIWNTATSPPQIVLMVRSGLLPLQQPRRLDPDLYPANADAKADIAAAVARAGHEHKRVLLVFGGNWCYDCDVLDLAFHRPDIEPLLTATFVVVNVDIGQVDKNLDLVKQYEIVLDKGVPALAVLESDGRLLYSQKEGEFESARSLTPEEIIAFLNRWKAK